VTVAESIGRRFRRFTYLLIIMILYCCLPVLGTQYILSVEIAIYNNIYYLVVIIIIIYNMMVIRILSVSVSRAAPRTRLYANPTACSAVVSIIKRSAFLLTANYHASFIIGERIKHPDGRIPMYICVCVCVCVCVFDSNVCSKTFRRLNNICSTN